MLLTRALVALIIVLSSFAVQASYWQDSDTGRLSQAQRGVAEPAAIMAKAKKSRHLRADIHRLRQQLLVADNVDIEIPLPNGEMAVYHLELSPIAQQGLLDKFPEIRTFHGIDVTNPSNEGHFDISPLGFRGMFRHNGELMLIDPQYVGDSQQYMAYAAKDAQPLSPRPADRVLYTDLLKSAEREIASRTFARGSSDGNLRTYRLAVAATHQYTQYFGGLTEAMSAITTAIHRVNIIYRRDLGIFLELVANNDLLIYSDAINDPYENNATQDIDINQTNIDNVIGEDNYDIGHVFGTGVGGLAGLGVVCNNAFKANGFTGIDNPIGDVFYIDFVAHELGHQFGAMHSFNGTSGSCGGINRAASSAFEPGSGSTVMAYAGICDDENLQNNSDPYFHTLSIQQIRNYISSQSCGEVASLGSIDNPNGSVPDVDAGPPITVPVLTPFILSPAAPATDADMDTLTYTWEQTDLGDFSCSPATMEDNGNRPIYRSFEPTAAADRYVPRLSSVVADTTVLGESYVTTSRTLNFRVTVRDGNGATAHDDKSVVVTDTAGPFVVTQPSSSGAVWSAGFEQVEWDVAGTDTGLVNCPNVDILLSTDNGASFPISLESATENDGNQLVSVPMSVSGPVRVMVRCSDNRFYAVSGSRAEAPASVPLQSCSRSTSSGGGASSGLLFLVIYGLLLLVRMRSRRLT